MKIIISPRIRGEGNVFINNCDDPALTDEILGAIEEGTKEAADSGVIMGYPVIDAEVSLIGIRVKESFSDAMAFKVAAGMAFQNACRKADPILLEPIMKTEILVPEEFMGEVIGDLNSRQGKIDQIVNKGFIQVITAHVSLSKMFGYSTSLRSVSQGRGTFSMQFSHYDRT